MTRIVTILGVPISMPTLTGEEIVVAVSLKMRLTERSRGAHKMDISSMIMRVVMKIAIKMVLGTRIMVMFSSSSKF